MAKVDDNDDNEGKAAGYRYRIIQDTDDNEETCEDCQVMI
jgi:hypothetical protein